MVRKFYRFIKKGKKDFRINQTVVAEEDGQYLVWYRASDSGQLNAYWSDIEYFHSLWTEDNDDKESLP